MSLPIGPRYAPPPVGYPMAPYLPPVPTAGVTIPGDVYQSTSVPAAPPRPVAPARQVGSLVAVLRDLISRLLSFFRRPTAAPQEAVQLPDRSQQSDEDFVTDLYRRLLHREPDPDGFRAHLELLRHGSSRQAIYEIFLGSPEYRELQSVARPPEPPAPKAPVPGSENGRLVDPKAYLFALLGVKEGDSAENWAEVLRRSGIPAGPGPGVRVQADAPFFGITQQINSAGEVRGRLFLPTDLPDENGYYVHAIDLLDGEPLRWRWKDWLGGPPYAPRPTT